MISLINKPNKMIIMYKIVNNMFKTHMKKNNINNK